MASTRTLDSPPGAATLYPRAVAGAVALPLLRRIPIVGPSQPKELPDTQLVLESVAIDPGSVADYARVCGFDLGTALPPTYLHLVAFPLAMQIMTATSFPFGVLGLVHVGNRIDQRRPIGLDEQPTVRVWAEDLRPHERGRQFDMVAEATVGGEVVWEDRSTYLRRGGGGSGASGSGDGAAKADKKAERPAPPEPQAVWSVPGDIGRRYGAVSGDRNPIHLHPLTAKVFGQPAAIAHGMWLKARCVAALAPSLPDAFSVDVRFKLPLVLPAKVGFSTERDGEARTFAVHSVRSGKPHLEGRVQPLA